MAIKQRNPNLTSKLKMPAGRVNKDIDAWLERAYQFNKKEIDSAINALQDNFAPYVIRRVDPKANFMSEMRALFESLEKDPANKGATKSEIANVALKDYGTTAVFYSQADVGAANAIAAIKKDTNVYKEFRMAWGWNTKLDWKLMKPTGEPNVYRMGHVQISFKNSPYGIEIIDLRKNPELIEQ